MLTCRAPRLSQTNSAVARVYADFNEMVTQEDLDLVSVCTPPFLHCAASVAALNAGINVICEKPMAMNAAECEEMIAAAQQNDRMLTIGFQSRFGERAQFLKHMIEQGELGEIYYARVLALRRRGIPWWGVFVEKDKNGGGPLIDIGVHTLDLTLWLMGHPTPTAVSGAVFTKLAKRPGLCIRDGRPADPRPVYRGRLSRRRKSASTPVLSSIWKRVGRSTSRMK